jgi:HlyD family secretion protein
MKRRTVYIILGFVLVAAVVAVTVWRRQQAQASESEEETRTAVVERGTLLVAVSASGGVEPQSSVGLTFETPGRVTDVPVKVGDRVENGDLLAQLDTRQLELQVHQAQAALAAAEAQLAQIEAGPRPEEVAAAEADVRAAQAQTSSAAANLDQLKSGATEAQIAAAETQVAQAELQVKAALLEYDRVRAIKAKEETIEQAAYNLYTAEKSLLAAQAALEDVQGGADAADIRAAQAGVDGAVAQQDAAQARLALLLAGATDDQIADAKAQVERAQAALEQAELSLKRATLHAPFDGVVARVNVSAGEMAPVGLPAITLLDPSGLQVAIGVDELDVGRLAVGQSAQVALDALPDTTLNGTVKSIAPAATVDAGGVTYYDVIVTLEPTDAPVRADMTANVTVVIEDLTAVLTIPLWVVHVDRRTGQTYVNRRAGNELERVDIALGVRYEGVAQVLDGLAEGDEVIWVSESRFDFGDE